MYSSHPLLDDHVSIGWDIDGTLIDGPNADFFRRYILANPDKEHHLITFRDPVWAERVYEELRPYGIERDHIHSLNPCPQDLYIAYATRKSFLDWAKCEAYLHWKGQMAKELGCTVLIDDMATQVIRGCEKHGIVYIDAWADDFTIKA